MTCLRLHAFLGTYPSFSFSVENLSLGPHFLVAFFEDGLGETFSVSYMNDPIAQSLSDWKCYTL